MSAKSEAPYDLLSDFAEICRFHGHSTPVLSLCYASQARLLLTGGEDESVKLFDVGSRTLVATCNITDWLPSPVRAVAISPDGSRAFVAARENVVRMIHLGPGSEGLQPIRFEGHDHWIRSLSLHWPTRRLATASNDSTIRIWNVDTGQELRRFQGTSRAVSVSLSENFVAVGFHEPVIRGCYINEELAPPVEFVGHTDYVISVCLGSRVLLSGSNDKTARVFDLQTQQCLCVLRGHAYSVSAVALCKTELRCVTGANDSTVMYWSLENGGIPLAKITGNFGSVRAISFLSSIHEICFSGWDGSVRMFDLFFCDKARLLALCAGGHERLGRNSPVHSIVSRDLLDRVKGFMILRVH